MDRTQPRRFEIRGYADTQSIEYMGMQGTDFHGELLVDFYAGQPIEIRWENVRADLYGGEIHNFGSGMNWQLNNTVTVENVDLKSLAEALARKPQPGGRCRGR